MSASGEVGFCEHRAAGMLASELPQSVAVRLLAVWLELNSIKQHSSSFFSFSKGAGGGGRQGAFAVPFLGSPAWKWRVLFALVRSVKTIWRREKL